MVSIQIVPATKCPTVLAMMDPLELVLGVIENMELALLLLQIEDILMLRTIYMANTEDLSSMLSCKRLAFDLNVSDTFL